METQSYAKTAVNTVKRLGNRGHYDYGTVHTIINTAPVLHVSFNDPEHPFPVVLPMLGCTGDFANPDADPKEAAQDIYIHGYVSARMFRKGKEAGEEGVPITVAATHIDGLVLSLTPFHNSCNYRSAIAYGHATLVTSPDERLYAMRLITDNVLPQRWDKSRIPPTKAELDSTSILKVRVESASAKVREGGPSEDRADLRDAELRARVWTGVVPVWLQWGEPVPAEGNEVGEVEGYIERWRLEENRRGKRGAYEAVEKGK
ncbi:5-nitroimidazole antibiotic resistance protein [Westerdykella ornata]|uniref:5-nitroimidazole antibiotic resistance protein n=1 Tax=Westerdykella ornata TaxID=318751 RepID=A0A6A6JI09_WESOR|nr:5-nitroimidazole antibiotic resistance protein [Westerdykella ornata]KAF2275834.1 5-nitroimidazole antibiotic resistance protein [Westerdykella ornata]